VERLPSSLGQLTQLKRLYIDHCESLLELPASLSQLTGRLGNKCAGSVVMRACHGNACFWDNWTMAACYKLDRFVSLVCAVLASDCSECWPICRSSVLVPHITFGSGCAAAL
jgi:hypothetical protein